MRVLRFSSILFLAVLLSAPHALGQVVEGAKKSVSEDSGPLSEISNNVGHGSRPVSEGSTTIGEASVGSMTSGPMHRPGTPSMISGPVSEISRGPVSGSVPVISAVSVREAAIGAVIREAQRPIGEPVLDLEPDLGALQERLRMLREQAEEEEALRESFGGPQTTDVEAVPADDTGTAYNQEQEAPPSAEDGNVDDGEEPAVDDQQ